MMTDRRAAKRMLAVFLASLYMAVGLGSLLPVAQADGSQGADHPALWRHASSQRHSLSVSTLASQHGKGEAGLSSPAKKASSQRHTVVLLWDEAPGGANGDNSASRQRGTSNRQQTTLTEGKP